MYAIHAVTFHDLVNVAFFVVVLLLAWGVLKVLFRLAWKLFLFGLGAILVLGVLLAIMRYLGGA